jgi:2-haloacid dehalogenase
MTTTLAFDVYGTLIDTAGVTKALETFVGAAQAADFSNLWRTKQLEYSFRRGLMQNYQNFGVCTKNALDYTAAVFKIEIEPSEKQKLLEGYRVLPAFPDVKAGLADLASSAFRLFAFSNGPADDVRALLVNAGIEAFFEDVVSVDEVRSFKPNPAVYCHFLRRAGSSGSDAWLISGNPFDVIGAVSAGMRAVWLQRSPASVFDPWELQPTATARSLTDIRKAIAGYSLPA